MISETDLRPIIAANIARLRAANEWSQDELASVVGVSRVQINRIERGKSTPSTELLYSLADALGVSADSLRQVPAEKKSPTRG